MKIANCLPLHFDVARELLSMVFSLYEVQWVMSYGVVELLASWPVDLIEIWNPILHCLMF